MSNPRAREVKPPRSLLWRLGGLALGVSVISLLLHMAVMTYALEPVGNELASILAARTRMVRTHLEVLPVSERPAAAERLSDPRFSVALSDPASQPIQTLGFVPRLFTDTLMSELGSGYTLLGNSPPAHWGGERTLRFTFELQGQRWQVEHRARPPVQVLLGTGLGWLLLAATAMCASLWLGLRFISRPLRELTERIATQGARLQPLAEPAGASVEVRSLVESFNRLVERLRNADRSKQQLLAGVSHDLRTPLARLRLRIETQCAPEVAAAAEDELRAVEHIVSQFLSYVQGELHGELHNDRQGGDPAAAGAKESLRELASQVVASYAEQGKAVHWLAAADDQQVSAVALQRLLTNLIDNALAHGQAPIDVVWRELSDGARELVVWDHGPGLTAEQFKAAQQPFVRLAQHSSIGHCGLGLAIVTQIATQWGAELRCQHDEAGRFGIAVVWPAAARRNAS
jgi:two-component system, OmpR family, osmolarity sensor histidine kinase EnvZ